MVNGFPFLAKAKSHELFYIWVTKLQAHRLFKRNEAAHVHGGFLQTLSHITVAEQAQTNGDLVTVSLTTCKKPFQRDSLMYSRIPVYSVFTSAELSRSSGFSCSIRSAALRPHCCEQQSFSLAAAESRPGHLCTRYSWSLMQRIQIWTCASRIETIKQQKLKSHCIMFYQFLKILLCLTQYSRSFISCIVCLSCLPELNRCHLDLSEINRLIQRLQVLEAGQAFTNGDLQRIISIQVARWQAWDCSFHNKIRWFMVIL